MVCRALMLSLCLYSSLRDAWSLQHFKRTPRHAHNRIIDHGNAEQNRNCDQDSFDNIFRHNIPHSWMKKCMLRSFCPLVIRTRHQMIRFFRHRQKHRLTHTAVFSRIRASRMKPASLRRMYCRGNLTCQNG